jgi:hypothetical protein
MKGISFIVVILSFIKVGCHSNLRQSNQLIAYWNKSTFEVSKVVDGGGPFFFISILIKNTSRSDTFILKTNHLGRYSYLYDDSFELVDENKFSKLGAVPVFSWLGNIADRGHYIYPINQTKFISIIKVLPLDSATFTLHRHVGLDFNLQDDVLKLKEYLDTTVIHYRLRENYDSLKKLYPKDSVIKDLIIRKTQDYKIEIKK